MGYNLFFCTLGNDTLVLITLNSLPSRLYDPSCNNPLPPFLPSSPVSTHLHRVYPARLLFLKLVTVEHSLAFLPLSVMLLEQTHGRSQTLEAPQPNQMQHWEGGDFVSSCLPQSVLLCCLTPAADSHLARLSHHLTLQCRENNAAWSIFSSLEWQHESLFDFSLKLSLTLRKRLRVNLTSNTFTYSLSCST